MPLSMSQRNTLRSRLIQKRQTKTAQKKPFVKPMISVELEKAFKKVASDMGCSRNKITTMLAALKQVTTT